MEVSGQHHALAALSLGGGGEEKKIPSMPQPETELRSSPRPSHYTDWAAAGPEWQSRRNAAVATFYTPYTVDQQPSGDPNQAHVSPTKTRKQSVCVSACDHYNSNSKGISLWFIYCFQAPINLQYRLYRKWEAINTAYFTLLSFTAFIAAVMHRIRNSKLIG
jgi:hypothetical protein